MLFVMLSLIAMLNILDETLRRGRLKLLVKTTRHKLFAIRDRLRKMAIEGQVSADDPLFRYLDTSLTKTAHYLPEINVYLFAAIHASTPATPSEIAHLYKALQNRDNQMLREIHEAYCETLSSFLASRHPILRLVVRSGFSFFKNSIGKSVETLTVDRRYSTYHAYCY